ncbi:hypothetical protein [Nocardia concava]|uniref:hypothetical protein n=1 Tax=Nocardia concava TaxID=257281 RepID=UPI0002EF39AC|nr:hypothetical protein [Nocardia concava]
MILLYYGGADRPSGAVINRLMNLAYSEYAIAVIAPSADHFEPDDIPALVKVADVICADTGTRHAIPPMTSTTNPAWTINCRNCREDGRNQPPMTLFDLVRLHRPVAR